MNKAFGRTRERRKPVINITSLIDVMFLLLIFFMVSSVFRDSVGLDITLPAAATAESVQEVEPHKVVITSDGTITLGDQTGLTREELEVALRDLIAKDPEARLALTADAKAYHEDTIAVIDIAKKVGCEKLILHTQPQRDSNEGQY